MKVRLTPQILKKVKDLRQYRIILSADLAAAALRIMRCCLVVCAVFFDVYANSIDPVNASLYDSFVKKMRKASAKGRCAAPWQQAHRIIHL